MTFETGTEGLKYLQRPSLNCLIPKVYLEIFISLISIPAGKFVAKTLVQCLKEQMAKVFKEICMLCSDAIVQRIYVNILSCYFSVCVFNSTFSTVHSSLGE